MRAGISPALLPSLRFPLRTEVRVGGMPRRRWRHEGCAAPEHEAAVRRVFLFAGGSEFLVDNDLRSFHRDVVEPADRVPPSQITLLIADPGEQEKAIEEIKQRYRDYFGT
jgi:hypothetical protein